jgi:outer membrane autotransporter protein
VSLYTALPALGVLYGRLVVDTLHQRVGEAEQLRGRTDIAEGRGIWMRGIYWDGKRDGDKDGVYGGDGPKFDYNIKALQAGFDLIRTEDDKGRMAFAGYFASIGHMEADVTHFTGVHAGDDDVDAYTLGVYATRFWPKDAYLDAVFAYNWFDMHAKPRRLQEISAKARSISASLEGGKPFHLDNAWLVEPEAQLIYQHGLGSDLADQGGTFRYDNTDSLIGRIGARVAKTWNRADAGQQTRLTTASARVSIWHEFLDRPSTTWRTETGPVTFVADTGKTWLELVGALSHQLGRKTTLYGDAGYNWDVNGRGRALSARLGVRFNW